MAPFIFLDNSLARNLMWEPEKVWNQWNDALSDKLGQDLQFTVSYYLFFEVIGFAQRKHLVKPDENIFQFEKSIKIKYVFSEADRIGQLMNLYWESAQNNIYNQLLNKEDDLIAMKDHQFSKVSEFDGSNDLKNILFESILKLFEEDFQEFAKVASIYLAWDYFCNINVSGISRSDFRKYQLDVWVQCYENGLILPLSKIIDDIDEVSLESSRFHPGDLVDAEALNFLIVGCQNQNKEYEPIHFMTYDSPQVMKNRIQLARKIFKKYGLEARVKLCFGLVWCFNHDMEILEKID